MTVRGTIALAAGCAALFGAAFGAGSLTRSEEEDAPARAAQTAPAAPAPPRALVFKRAARLPDLRERPQRTPAPAPAGPAVTAAAPAVPVSAPASAPAPAGSAPSTPAPQSAPDPAPAQPRTPAASSGGGDEFFDGG